VLIAGEAGTGREAVARAIHAASSRAGEPFIAIDCAADPHRRLSRLLTQFRRADSGRRAETVGAARTDHGAPLRGVDGGTLFLRNPFDLPIQMQAELARLLRDSAAVKSRDGRPVRLSVRPIAAVDSGFRARVDDGTVGPELYRRFSAVRIDLAPLRARPGDIPEFAQAVVDQVCQERHVATKRLTPAALALLSAFPWWGNVVELHDLLDAMVRRATDGEIDLQEVLRHVQLDGARAVPVAVGTLREARSRFEREYISGVLARHNGRISTAAVDLGLERANLYRKMRQLGVRRQGLP
jgi:two-component system nitrogen regulation response regulator NtrX